MRSVILAASVVLAALVPAMPAQGRGDLYERVVQVLEDRFYDREFRRQELPEIAARYRLAAYDARTLAGERAVVHAMLAEIPASHLSLLSQSTFDGLMGALRGERIPTLGCELVGRPGGYFVYAVWEGGPAERAGLRRGDRVVRIDGERTAHSPRLDWRSDDANLPDPPIHALLCEPGEEVELRIEWAPGRYRTLSITARDYSALSAARASAEIVHVGSSQIGYIHFWFVHHAGVARLLSRLLRGEFAACDGLVLDLRGRGGSAAEVRRVVRVLEQVSSKPVVALIDRGSRSAKEVIAYEVRRQGLAVLVGERTAGAVIPASFRRVGPESWLMLPEGELGDYTRWLEGRGVAPDVEVEDAGDYAAGADPIREAGLREIVRMLASG